MKKKTKNTITAIGCWLFSLYTLWQVADMTSPTAIWMGSLKVYGPAPSLSNEDQILVFIFLVCGFLSAIAGFKTWDNRKE